MTARTQQARTGNANTPPGVLPPGQLYVEMANPLRLWTGVPTSIDATGRRALVDATNPGPWLPIAGGTLTGLLTLSGPPTTNLHAATKAYADTKLALAGGTLTGPLVLAADPTVILGAATKQYADTKLPIAGGTLTGPLTVPSLTVSGSGTSLTVAGSSTLHNIVCAGLGVEYTGIGGSHWIAFQWDGSFLNGFVDNTAVGQLAGVAWANSTFKPASAYTPNQNVDTGASPAFADVTASGAFRLAASGAYFFSDAQHTWIEWDGAGWALQYLRANGELSYINGSGQGLFSIDNAGNVWTPGSIGPAGNLTAGGEIANGGMRATAAELFISPSSVGTAFQFYGNASARVIQFSDDGWNLQWQTNGSLVYYDNTGTARMFCDNGGNLHLAGAIFATNVSELSNAVAELTDRIATLEARTR